MPDLSSLPSGSSVFVDTNIFDLHYRGRSVSCTAFIQRMERGEFIGYVNTQVLSDLLHKLMLAEAVQKGFILPRQGAAKLRQRLTANRTIAGQLTDYQQQFETTLAIGLKCLRITKNLLVETKQERVAHGLLVGDSLHLGNMVRHTHPIRDFVTHDSDFQHIPSIQVWMPMDVIPP